MPSEMFLFEVPEGQILGITGKNGSGKSTMLRAIAGIFSADSGEIDLHGHTISLLSIGVGFKNELSGRENIILSGMLLGFSKEFIMEKMPDIIDFAGIGSFIDMPVRTYFQRYAFQTGLLHHRDSGDGDHAH